MGNLVQLRGPAAFDWQNHFEVVENNLHDQYFLLRSLQTGEEFIGKEIVANAQQQIAAIEQLISLKINTPCQYVTKLIWTAGNKGLQYCSYQTKYYLLFEKYYLTLKQQKINQQFKCQSFSEGEVLSVLQSMMRGLLYLKKIGQPHQRVCLQNIYIRDDKTIVLSDPWLFPRDYTSIFNFHVNGFIYPSPEKILYENHMVQNYDLYISDYYSLGVLLLELLYMQQMDIIYERGFRRILEEGIKAKLGMIGNQELKMKLKILLSYDPRERKKIEKFYGGQFVQTQRGRISEKILENNQQLTFNQKEPSILQLAQPQILPPLKSITANHLQANHVAGKNQAVVKNQNNLSHPIQYPNHNKPKVFFTYLQWPQPKATIYYPILKSNHSEKIKIVQSAADTYPHKNEQENTLKIKPNAQHEDLQHQQSSNYLFIKPQAVLKQNSLNISINNSEVNLTMVKNSMSEQGQTNQVSFKKIQEINHLFKEVISLNTSEDRSQRASQVICHGFNTQNELNSLNQISLKQLNGRASLPSHSGAISFQKNVKKSSKSCVNFQKMNNYLQVRSSEGAKQSIQLIPAQPKIQIPSVTPQRSYPTKKFNSTIKQVSEDQNSVSSYENQYEERAIEYDVGTRYTGQIKNGKRNGRGLFYYKDGSYYEGYWKDNKMHGKGSLYYSNGNLAYDGNWYMDSFHGRGKIYNDCIKYSSSSLDYKMLANDYVDESWEVYQGDFFYQQKHGKGKLKFANGEVYAGQFTDDMIHGEGRFYRLNGEVVSGVWKNGYYTDQS